MKMNTRPVEYLLLVAMFALSACVSHTRERTVVHERPPVEREVVVVDPHRGWWDTYHRDEQYDRERALESHRLWCDEHPSDGSCRGWYTPR